MGELVHLPYAGLRTASRTDTDSGRFVMDQIDSLVVKREELKRHCESPISVYFVQPGTFAYLASKADEQTWSSGNAGTEKPTP